MSLKALIGLVVGFCVGIGIESVTNQSQYFVIWILGLALVVGLIWRRASEARPAPYLIVFCLFLLSMALGMFRTQVFEIQFDNSLQTQLNQDVTIVGQVISEPDLRTTMQMLYVEYQDEVVLVSTDRSLMVSYGDMVEVEGKLEKPANFITDLGREFNYQGYLQAKGVEYRISFAKVEIIESSSPSFVGALLSAKQLFMRQLDEVFAEPQGSLADGLLLGLNQGLGDELEEDFRRSGIIHIVVLSGYNIMLVIAFVMFALKYFLSPKPRLILGLLAIVSFVLIVGMSATAVRASIMAALLLITQTFHRSYDVLRALLFAGLVMLAINPYLLFFDIGFQLSFMATLGLILAIPLFDSSEQPEVLGNARGYIVATIATQLAVLPLLIYHIGEVSLVSVLVNLLVLPVVPFAMFGSFMAGITHAILSPLGLSFGYLSQLSLTYIIAVAEFFAALPFATMQFSAISPWWLLPMYGTLGVGVWWLSQRFLSNDQDNFLDWTIEEESDEAVEGAGTASSTKDSLPKMFR